MATTDTTVRIDDRYRGFPGLAMGGVSGGLLADRLGDAVEVTFRRPIPTDEPLAVVTTNDAAELHLGGEVAARATPTTVDVARPDPVGLETAEAATQAYRGHREHPYPSCFTCGPDREEGDGLRVFPGRVDAVAPEVAATTPADGSPADPGPLVAAAWRPHPDHADADGTLPPEHVWAALDCSSIWPVIEAAPADSPDHVVSGRLAVALDGPVRAGEPHVVLAWPLGGGPERPLGAAAILDADGAVRALARHTLVVTDWGIPLGIDRWGDEG